MVGLSLFTRARSRSRSANAATENQLLAAHEQQQRFSTSTDKKRVEPVVDDSENTYPNRGQTLGSAKRQKTTSSSSGAAGIMSAFSSGFMKKISFGKSKSTDEKLDCDDDVSAAVATTNQKYQEGCYVATKYGTAIVLQFRDEDDMYVLRMVYNAVAYFHTDSVVREIKCMVGDRWLIDVVVGVGMATVEHYYVDQDKYSIALDWRWDDDHVWRMKATTKMFDIPTPATATLKSRAAAARDVVSKTIGDGYSSFRMSSVAAWRPSTTSYTSLIRMTSSGVKPPTPIWSTLFGEGRLLSVRAADHIATVTFVGMHGAVAYLERSAYIDLAFGTGDAIVTIYGAGRVVAIRGGTTFEIQLVHGATLYTTSPAAILAKKTAPVAAATSTYFKMPSALPKFQLPSLPAAAATRKDKYAVGDKLRSVFGAATIVAARPDVFECALDGAMLYVPVSQMETTFPEALNPSRLGKLYEKTKEWHVFSSTTMLSSAHALKASVKSTLDSAFKKGPRFAMDERVLCPKFGSGFVVGVRHDGVYVVKLRKLRIVAYFHEHELKPFPYEKATHVIVGEKMVPVPMEVYQATNKKSRSTIIKESMASQHVRASLQ
ncbi:Aste57867_922 [Aphanomyces stellatus]|uniref:Aste57867_922 protein n=1 Tax=Aphanomyces stellatus TaxID=120398 RepID=A0A485K744_9STRA|nr:hypothetical protein As57867_000921 [Aphanomyces stellatus]VFT78146.1 Aste57867_922 [Aphanomyces stellatus]